VPERADEGTGLRKPKKRGDIGDTLVLRQQLLCGLEPHFVGKA
jgi:hypothetical protein